ncbi:MAG: helix-turn-helix domain-containing protein [Opitutales bacterium]
MLEIDRQIIEEVIAPILAAQIFLFVLVYFTLVKKRIADNYKVYVCFLLAFIVFLVTRPFQLGLGWSWNLVYLRMPLLFAVVLPTFTLAIVRHSRARPHPAFAIFAYGLGTLFAFSHAFIFAARWNRFGLKRDDFPWLPLENTDHLFLTNGIQVTAALLFIIVPCFALIVREARSMRRPNLFTFLTSALIFGVLLVIGTVGGNNGLYYIGSIIFAGSWAWVVYKDIRDLKSKVTLLNEELQHLVQSGPKSLTPEIEIMLGDLEELSNGNIEVYKMRVRAILNMLAELTIQAGADSESSALRNRSLAEQIEASDDPGEIQKLLQSEAVEVSEFISDEPEKHTAENVERAKSYIQEHFAEDLSVDTIAEALGVSRYHFMREFKKHTGETVNQHLTTVRVEHAKVMLSEKNVTETAFAVGYNSSSYFSRVFKKHTGMSPAEFLESSKS